MEYTCSECGDPILLGTSRSVPFSLRPGQAICSHCWANYWHEKALAETRSFRSDSYDGDLGGIGTVDHLFDSYVTPGPDGWVTLRNFDDSSSPRRLCVRCLDDYVDEGSYVCSMCGYEQLRESRRPA